jgi:hypothetical protein
MESKFISNHWTTDDGVPDGGNAYGTGFCITFQRGAIRKPDGSTAEQTGAFMEDVLGAVADRLKYHQSTKNASEENAKAIECIEEAINQLNQRILRLSSVES